MFKRRNTSSSQNIGHWLQIVDSQELGDPELASPFVEWCSPKPSLNQSHSPLRSTTDTSLNKAGEPGNLTIPQHDSAAASPSSSYNYSSEPVDYDSSSDIESSSLSPLKEGDLALVRKPSRVISPTPKLRRKKRDVHIHLSLTDSQLEKMASIFASSQSHPEEVPASPEKDPRYPNYKSPPPRSRKNAPKTLHHKEGSSSLGSHTHRRIPSENRGHNKYDFDLQYGSSTDAKSPEGEGEKTERPITVATDWSAIIRTVSRSPSQDKLPLTRASSSRTKIPAPMQKDKKRPVPLNLADARRYGEVVSHRKNIEVVHNPVPATPAIQGNHGTTVVDNNNNFDGSSSVYTSDPPTTSTPAISPLRIKKRTTELGRKLNVLKAYNDYKESTTPNPESALLKTPFRSKSATVNDMKQKGPEILDNDSTMPNTADTPSSPRNSHQGKRSGIPKSATTNDLNRDAQPEPFTPLTPWLLASSVHITKNLFGEHGWLKDTSAPEAKQESQKNSGFLVAEKADFKNTSNRPRSKIIGSSASGPSSPRRHGSGGPKRLAISLDPREQSLLYCELEYSLSNTLDLYIKTQLNGGRLDPAKLKKVSDGWAAKGRPRVIGFRYDLETQVELVRLHLYQFRFYHSYNSSHQPQHRESLLGGAGGGSEESTTAIDAVLYAVKCNARVMRVRSLCQPDSVIAKHVLDAQALLGLLGAAEGMHRSLAEVSQFFKVVVERERAVRRTREASIRALPHEVAAAMGQNETSRFVVDQESGDVSFQQQQRGNNDAGEENVEGVSQVPPQYQQQTVSTAAQRQSTQPQQAQQQSQQQKVTFAIPSSSSSAAAVAPADTSLAEQGEEDQSMLQYVPPPPQLGDHQHEQPADGNLVTLSSQAYRVPSGERSYI
ncbi:uncharacterized protein PG998_009992 [Apiospora kogelbergensis]|uniref:uncharacterized protein n=1 Tax=Apiospora kogelbergensis TaxID=1337665 RepID=UPI003130AB21